MNNYVKVYVAGISRMVGSAVVRYLNAHGFNNFALRTSKELDFIR